MDRLTQRCGDAVLIADRIDGQYSADEVIDILAERLAGYEDTGQTPEEINETVRQLDTIVNKYGLYHSGRGDAILELLTACKSGKLAFLPCPIGSAVYVIGFKTRHGKTESFVNTGSFRFSDMEKLGVTVFLTRREAEEAIAKTEKALAAVGL